MVAMVVESYQLNRCVGGTRMLYSIQNYVLTFPSRYDSLLPKAIHRSWLQSDLSTIRKSTHPGKDIIRLGSRVVIEFLSRCMICVGST